MTDRKPTCVACKGAGGADYTAGTGIVIEDKEISADTSVLATKTELPDMTEYQLKLVAGTGITIDADNVISAMGDSGMSEHTATDWSDVFEITDGGKLLVKKNALMIVTMEQLGDAIIYLPKGTLPTQYTPSVMLPYNYGGSGVYRFMGTTISFSTSLITGASFTATTNRISISDTNEISNAHSSTTYYKGGSNSYRVKLYC